MELVAGILIGTVISWITLLIVVPIAQKLADFGMPPLPQMLWMLAVVAVANNGVAILLGLVNPFLGWAGGVIVFWTLMWKWFDLDLWGAVIIVVVSWVLQMILLTAVMGLLFAP